MEIKKTTRADVDRKRGLYFQIGIVTALLLVIAAFQWTTPQNQFQYETITFIDEEIEMINTRIEEEKPKPPPPPITEEIKIVPDDVETLPDESIMNSDLLNNLDFSKFRSKTKEEVDEELPPLDYTEVMPEFCSGTSALYKLISSQLKYPEEEKRLGIQGLVFVSFVVEPDGTISNVEILRSVSKNIDAEALRVVKQADCWKPGLQAGRPQRVKVRLPIRFTLK